MDAIAFLIYFVNMLTNCSAEKMDTIRLGGQDYQRQAWTCKVDQGPITVRAWRVWCETNGHKYMGRPFFLEFRELGEWAYYGNRFGEIQGGPGAMLENAYVPPCGS